MSKYDVRSKTVVTLQSSVGTWVFETQYQDMQVGIVTIDWIPTTTVVTLHGWASKTGSTDKDRSWQSVLPFSELPDDIRAALLGKVPGDQV